MKRKILVPVLVAAVGGTALVAQVAPSFQQENIAQASSASITNVVGDNLEIRGFNETGEAGERVFLPVVSATDAGGNPVAVITRIMLPSGRVLDNATEVFTDTVSGRDYFVPATRGQHVLTFEAQSATGVVATTFGQRVINVVGPEFSIVMPVNSPYVVPGIIGVSDTNPLRIPAPTIFHGEDEVDSLAGLAVSVRSAAGAINQLLTPSVDSNGVTYFAFMPTTAGVFTINYVYTNGGVVQDTRSERFVVQQGFSHANLNMVFNYASTRPTTAVLGVPVTLPRINVTDRETGQPIAAYTSIRVRHVQSDAYVDVENFSFTPMLAGDYIVTYQAINNHFGIQSVANSFRIEQVRDTIAPEVFVTNNFEINETTGEVTRVTDFRTGAVLYDIAVHGTQGGNLLPEDEREELVREALGNITHAVPSVAVWTPAGEGVSAGATVTLPAIFATDNFDTLQTIEFTRSIRNNETGVVTDLTNYSANNPRNPFQSTEFTFASTGHFTIRYIARDAAGNQRMSSFDIRVLAESELRENGDWLLPTISMQALPNVIRANETLAFNRPTASDRFDTRVEVVTAFTLFNSSNVAIYTGLVTDTNAASQLALNLRDIDAAIMADAAFIEINVQAFNDYAVDAGGNRLSAPFTARRINIINTAMTNVSVFTDIDQFLPRLADLNLVDDRVGYTIDENGFMYDLSSTRVGEPFNQQDVIRLPEINATDINDAHMSLSVRVTDPFGNPVTLFNSRSEATNSATPFAFRNSGGNFVANFSGVYTVTYVARNAGGNYVVRTFGIRVRSTVAPTIVLNTSNVFQANMQLGQRITIPAASLRIDGVMVDNITHNVPFDPLNPRPGVMWEIVSGLSHTPTPDGFIPHAEGEFTVVYRGWNVNGVETETQRFTITVRAGLNPTMVLEQNVFEQALPFVEGEPIILPGISSLFSGVIDNDNPSNSFTQTDRSNITVRVQVTFPDGTTRDATPQPGGTGRFQYTPTRMGVYQIVYTATDNFGNVTRIEKSQEVGDVTPPTLTWDADREPMTTARIGERLELNFNHATIAHNVNVEGVTDQDRLDELEYVTKIITMTRPDGTIFASEITDGFAWTFSEAGTYTLNIRLRNASGVESAPNAYRYTITVTTDERDGNIIAPWLGTTLIVTSSVILAGVVIYFILSSKKPKGGSSASRTTKGSSK